jgi:hypothetical protein
MLLRLFLERIELNYPLFGYTNLNLLAKWYPIPKKNWVENKAIETFLN